MDNDLKIKSLQELARREREMRLLQSERLDTHDLSFDHVISGFDRIRGTLEEITLVQKQFAIDQALLAADQAKTDTMLRDLIAALTARAPTASTRFQRRSWPPMNADERR